jgi:nitric oxide reductase NorQ protein
MNRLELEALDIDELRKLAKKAKLKTKLKAKIVAALADDYREGKATNIAAPSLNGTAPGTTPPAPDTDSIVWPDVPPAVSAVNGDYVEPPWLAELVAAASIGHVELMGPAGSGKTLAVHHLAAQQGRKLAVVTADGGLRKRDLIGQVGMSNGSTRFVAAEYAAAARNGDWALIDEANMAEPDAISFINGQTDRPGQIGSTFQLSGQTIEVHPDFRLFITRNPGYVGTRSMNEALRDRMWPIMVPPLSGESLAAMFAAHDVDAADIPESVWLIDQLYKAWENNTISYQVSPRRALSAAHMFTATSQEDIRYWLGRSILNMIDAKHDQESVSQKIDAAWRAYDLLPGDHHSKTYGQ